MATSYTELLEPTKSEKHGCFIFTPGSTDFTNKSGTLTISGTRSYTVYDVEEFPCDHGRGFLLRKTAGGTDKSETHYSCFVGTDDVCRCECKGYYATGRCKHLASLADLVRTKRI